MCLSRLWAPIDDGIWVAECGRAALVGKFGCRQETCEVDLSDPRRRPRLWREAGAKAGHSESNIGSNIHAT